MKNPRKLLRGTLYAGNKWEEAKQTLAPTPEEMQGLGGSDEIRHGGHTACWGD